MSFKMTLWQEHIANRCKAAMWVIGPGLAAALLLTLALAVLAQGVDISTSDRETLVLETGLTRLISEREMNVIPQVMWDDAVVNLDNTFDNKWASENIGAFLTQTAGFEDAFIIDPENRQIYATKDADFIARFRHDVTLLANRIRAAEAARGAFAAASPNGAMISQPVTTSALVRDGAGLILLTATLVQPDFGTALPKGSKAPVVFTLDALNADFVTALADRYVISDLKLNLGATPPSGEFAFTALKDSGGHTVGHFQWTAKAPGRTLLMQSLPVLVVLGLALIWTTGLIRRRLMERDQEVRNAAERETLARAAAQAKDRFLAKMSHELRTPLNAIIGYSELLRDEAQDADRTDEIVDLDKIINASAHLLTLINELLDLEKIGSGMITMRSEAFELSTLLDEVSQTIAPIAMRHKAEFITQGTRSLGVVHTDRLRLKQALINLLSNACKFSSGGTVTLRASPVGEFLRFDVIDTGIGMTSEQLARVFEPFEQADANTQHVYGGSGLGLSLTREIATLLGGTIEATSTPGAGSTFTLKIAANMGEMPRALAA